MFKLKKWWSEHALTVAVVVAIIFLIVYVAFRDRINAYYKDKKEFRLPVSSSTSIPKAKGVIIGKKYESRCREIFESIFNRPFPTVRPSFLKRANGRALELDGYNEQLKLAFEYQGRQHAEFSTRFHRSPQDFEDQKVRDADKKVLCAKAGVTLIEIPHTVKYADLPLYINRELRRYVPATDRR